MEEGLGDKSVAFVCNMFNNVLILVLMEEGLGELQQRQLAA